jgi:hypothetical protein
MDDRTDPLDGFLALLRDTGVRCRAAAGQAVDACAEPVVRRGDTGDRTESRDRVPNGCRARRGETSLQPVSISAAASSGSRISWCPISV